MVLEADRAGEPYRTYATVGGNRPGAEPMSSEWKYLGVLTSTTCRSIRRGRCACGSSWLATGEVWIDDVQLYNVLFPLPTYQHESQEKIQFVKLRSGGEIGLRRRPDRR